MLNLIKEEVRFEVNVIQTEEDVLEYLNDIEIPETVRWSDRLFQAFKVLNDAEREFIHWYFVEGLSQAECAEKAGVSVTGIKKRRPANACEIERSIAGYFLNFLLYKEV